MELTDIQPKSHTNQDAKRTMRRRVRVLWITVAILYLFVWETFTATRKRRNKVPRLQFLPNDQLALCRNDILAPWTRPAGVVFGVAGNLEKIGQGVLARYKEVS